MIRKLLTTAAATAGVLLLAACSSPTAVSESKASPTPTAFTVNGSISAPGASETGSDGETCATQSGYDDIATGDQVVVSDAAGKTIAIGTLETGGFVEAAVACKIPFTVTDVPIGEKFYGVHIGNQARGIVQFSSAEMKDGPALSITR